jgi:hypothetical protein
MAARISVDRASLGARSVDEAVSTPARSPGRERRAISGPAMSAQPVRMVPEHPVPEPGNGRDEEISHAEGREASASAMVPFIITDASISLPPAMVGQIDSF